MRKNKILLAFLFLIVVLSSFTVYLLKFYPQELVYQYQLPVFPLEKVAVYKGSQLLQILSQDELNLSAQSAYAVDLDSQTILFQKNENQILYPASTTKMMTALLAREDFDLADTLLASSSTVIGNQLDFIQGEEFKTEDLLAALLIISANDVAYLFAENETYYPGEFLEKMNQKATDLNLEQTHYVNAAGFDELGQNSSAHDLTILAQEILKDQFLSDLVSTKEKVIVSSLGNEYYLYNTNHLLGSLDGVKGVKTGTTELAGEVLVTLVERDGHRILLSLMKSEDRYGDTEKLLAWILNNYHWRNLEYSAVAGF